MVSGISSLMKRRPLVAFFVLAYAISWGLIPFWTFQAGGPFIAAFAVTLLTRGLSGPRELGSRKIRWRVRWYSYAAALSLPLAAARGSGTGGARVVGPRGSREARPGMSRIPSVRFLPCPPLGVACAGSARGSRVGGRR
jgi:hypothetical protein